MKYYSKDLGDWFSNLENILRTGARDLMQSILEEEASAYVEEFKALKDERNRRLVKRNGYSPERNLLTGIGPISISRVKPFILRRFNARRIK